MDDVFPPPPPPNVRVRVYETPTAQGHVGMKILLLKLDHIGDFITGLEAFKIIRHAFPGAEITLICLPSIVSLAESTNLFDKVKGFAAVPASKEIGQVPTLDATKQIDIFKSLLDEPYFMAADFRHDPYNRFGIDYVEAKYRAAFGAQTTKGLDIIIPTMEWDVPSGAVAAGKNMPPHAETRLTLLAHAITDTLLEKALDADLFHTVEDLSDITSFRALESQTRMKIGLSVGAGSELRQWKSEYWMQLLPRLAQTHNAVFVFVGGPEDKAETQKITACLEPDVFVDLTGQIALEYVPAYINALDAYIGCDTGLTHLAASLGIPTVNIFAGVSNVSVWRAKGPKVKTIYAELGCAPCHKRLKSSCPHDNICMNIIIPDIVFACFQEVIATRTAAHHESDSCRVAREN